MYYPHIKYNPTHNVYAKTKNRKINSKIYKFSFVKIFRSIDYLKLHLVLIERAREFISGRQ